MARLASDSKMGYYPTPPETLGEILKFIRRPLLTPNSQERIYLLDPCCGEGEALERVALRMGYSVPYGIELDVNRASKAFEAIGNVVQGSMFEVKIEPLEAFSLLYLNPPYSTEDGERVEMRFLKHSIKWLRPDGVLVFLVPERIFESEKNRIWISRNFNNCQIFRFTRGDFPRFKQAVLFGRRRENGKEEEIHPPPYPHIEDIDPEEFYLIPPAFGPVVFRGSDVFTEEEILGNRSKVIEEIQKLKKEKKGLRSITPLMPLRKGHLVALLTAGFLDGKVETPEGPLWVRGFSERVTIKRVEDDKEITRNTYWVGVRVIDEGEGVWYDIK